AGRGPHGRAKQPDFGSDEQKSRHRPSRYVHPTTRLLESPPGIIRPHSTERWNAGNVSGRFEFVLDNIEACVVGQALDVDIRRFPLRIQGIPSDPVRLAKLATIVTGELTKRRLVV